MGRGWGYGEVEGVAHRRTLAGLAPCSKREFKQGVWQQEMLAKRGLKLSSSLSNCAPG